jgi:hypothetical protein
MSAIAGSKGRKLPRPKKTKSSKAIKIASK